MANLNISQTPNTNHNINIQQTTNGYHVYMVFNMRPMRTVTVNLSLF